VDEADGTLKGNQLVRFREAEAKVAAIMAQVRHIVDR
jgi:hypothetical protein